MIESDWPFDDAPNDAVFTVRQIMDESAWIHYVSHDDAEGDGAWQFFASDPPEEEDGVLVTLSDVVELDDSLRQLADLPLGWCAWRDAPGAEWKCGELPPD